MDITPVQDNQAPVTLNGGLISLADTKGDKSRHRHAAGDPLPHRVKEVRGQGCGGSSAERFIPSAPVCRAISADSGRDVAGARGLRGFLGGDQEWLFLPVTERGDGPSGRGGTGGQPARDICIHSGQRLIRAQKTRPSRNALRPRSHTLSYTQECMWTRMRHTKP
ncbi:hypothetical protein NQZ68_015684 [Dissostichus eleginoides]|nr:hypothetical protein NQZ68_015684 [Dissostichus eleginoides]